MILMLCAVLLVMLPCVVMAVDGEGDVKVKYQNLPYRYNPMTQVYDRIDETDIPAGEREETALQNALVNGVKFPYTAGFYNTFYFDYDFDLGVPYDILNKQQEPLGQEGDPKYYEDGSGRTVIEYTYNDVRYKWTCIGYSVTRANVSGIHLWTDEELQNGYSDITFTRNESTITYVWVNEGNLEEDFADGNFDKVNITFHLTDHFIGTDGQSVYKPFEVPFYCEFESADAVIYVGQNRIDNDPDEIVEAIDGGEIVPITKVDDFNDFYNSDDDTIKIEWAQGHTVSFSQAWQLNFNDWRYVYVKISAGGYEWYRSIDTSSWSLNSTDNTSGSGRSSTTAADDVDVYSRMSWSEEPIPAEGYALVGKIHTSSHLLEKSDWSEQDFREVISQISYDGTYEMNMAVPETEPWNLEIPTPVTSFESENGEVILKDNFNTWRCVGYTIDPEEYYETGSYTKHNDWSNKIVISVDDITEVANITASGSYLISIYYIWEEISWTGEGTPTMYTIEYDANVEGLEDLTENVEITRIDGIEFDDDWSEYYYISERHDSGPTFNEIAESLEGITNNSNESVREKREFTVGEYPSSNGPINQYYDFLIQDENAKRYFKFGGWVGEDNKTYNFGETVVATSELAGDDGIITFKANWIEIPESVLSDEQLEKIKNELPLDAFTYGSVSENVLITQAKGSNNFTSDPLQLNADETISYQVSASVDHKLIGSLDANLQNYKSEFAYIQFHVYIDEDLEFANVDEDGKVRISFSAAPRSGKTYAPVTLKSCNIDEEIIQRIDEGIYTITFAPKDVKTDADGRMHICLELQWAGGGWQADDHKVSDTDASADMTVTGLDFKLKDSAVSADGEIPVIESSANLTAQIYPRNLTHNLREYYTKVTNFLESDEWHEYFLPDYVDDKGSCDYARALPSAYAKAIQFVNYKLNDYNLADDALSYFKANTVVANSDFIITATAGEGGTISPSGDVKVKRGDNQSFTITPENGWEISDVKVNGSSVGAVSSYTFSNVNANATIHATFVEIEEDDGGGIIIMPYYTLIYETNGAGEISDETEFYAWTKPYDELPVLTLDGYVFDGWYYDEELTRPVVGDVEVDTYKVYLYAGWSLDESDPDNNGVSDLLDTENHISYLNGYPDDSFRPQNNMTRAEAAQMFYNLLVNKDVMITVEFDDVDDDAWYATAVNTLASMGILEGIGDNLFAPEKAITRAEFTAIAMRFANLDVEGENIFTDVSEDAWYYEYVVGSIKYGWINGYPDGTFRPDSTITRAEVTAITNRMLGRAADEAYVDANADILREFTDLDTSLWAYYDIVEATNTHEYTKLNGIESWE